MVLCSETNVRRIIERFLCTTFIKRLKFYFFSLIGETGCIHSNQITGEI